jgi:3-oxoacyl-[acyl-carrier protein] reductase/sorbitol-6-phosphate 2-dehydrogenase
MGRLDDKIAVVTGASRGLGEGIARRFADEGAVVVCADVLDASEVATSLPVAPSGAKPMAVRLDVTNTDEVEAVFNSIADEYGRVDILANNAGVAQPIADVIDTADEVFERVFAVNVRGVLACSRAAAHIMKRHDWGRIINTASQTGKVAWPGWGIYSASKFAVVGLTQVLALELAPSNITVNAICPGTMLTDMTRTGFGAAAANAGRDREELLAEHIATIPMQRLGTPDDIGALAAFLASDDAAFTTGASINLTGGEQVFF